MTFKIFTLQLSESIQKKQFVQATLSSPHDSKSPFKIKIRSVEIRGGIAYQATKFLGTQTFHENFTPDDCLTFLIEQIQTHYKQVLVVTVAEEYHLVWKSAGVWSIKKKNSQKELALQPHNRKKQTLLREGDPIPFLMELGIMGAEGKILSGKRDKFRQINRFLEMVSDVLPALPKDKKIRIVDFGCGKSYLTFALYHLLRFIENREIEILGIDLKEDVIVFCRNLAEKLDYSGLYFAVGDINSQNEKSKVDMVVTLHACDTATDAALEKAVRWEADVILSVPCCQHELYAQIQNDNLKALLKHGILRERFASLATDAARAQLLECLGYHVQVLEFIDMEHTPKNLLIRAVKKTSSDSSISKQKAIAEYRAFKDVLSIHPSMEERFKQDLGF
jgi:SAM-dependent methyltransferase